LKGLEKGHTAVQITDEMVAAGAKAMYQAKVSRVQKIIAETNFEIVELPDIFVKLQSESETAQILIFSSFLEDKIEQLLRFQLKEKRSAVDDAAMFSGNGPLGTFSNRIMVAHQLGWLRDENKRRINLFRKLRNEFAHAAYRVSFSDAKIVSYFGNLKGDLEGFIARVGPLAKSQANLVLFDVDEIDLKTKYLCWLAILAHSVCMDLLLLPKCLAFEVDPADVSNTKTAPDVITDITRAMIGTLFHLIGTEKMD
jgi:hypothetical protein